MGEGRGHASRARAMIERLNSDHRIIVTTSHDALAFLRDNYPDDPQVEVHEIPGLKFHYSVDKLDNIKTIRKGLSFWAARGKYVRQLLEKMQTWQPDLVVCDFEPLVPRAARKLGVPVLSLDHQHFMSTYDLTSLPGRLQRWAWLMSWSIWAFGIRQDETVISSFYKPPLRANCSYMTQVGPLLRPAVRAQEPIVGGHLLSYLRRATPPRVLDLLAESPIPVRVYGLGEREPRGSITFCKIDEVTFLEDLASSQAVVAAAGNQLLGEALYFGKPVFALPELSHHEQCINACFLKQLGGGDWRHLEKFNTDDLKAFLSDLDKYREQLATSAETFDGTDEAAEAIQQMLDRYANT